MIRLLSAAQVNDHREEIKNLLTYCRFAGSGEILMEHQSEEKVDALAGYLRENRAFFFGAFEEDALTGFLWACELGSGAGRCFHILYFAVAAQHHGKGIGGALIRAAEEQARKMGIAQMELNVHAGNQAAVDRYLHWNYEPQRITMKKML